MGDQGFGGPVGHTGPTGVTGQRSGLNVSYDNWYFSADLAGLNDGVLRSSDLDNIFFLYPGSGGTNLSGNGNLGGAITNLPSGEGPVISGPYLSNGQTGPPVGRIWRGTKDISNGYPPKANFPYFHGKLLRVNYSYYIEGKVDPATTPGAVVMTGITPLPLEVSVHIATYCGVHKVPGSNDDIITNYWEPSGNTVSGTLLANSPMCGLLELDTPSSIAWRCPPTDEKGNSICVFLKFEDDFKNLKIIRGCFSVNIGYAYEN